MQIRENISLRPYNSFGIEATARYFATFSTLQALEEFVRIPAFSPSAMILGGGSNILLTKDQDLLVLKNEVGGIEVVKENEDFVYLKAGAGVNWHQLVLYCVERNLGGAENLALIPGNVGASPMQNIGAYGVEIKDIFHELEAYHLFDRVAKTFSVKECEFGYRESVFKQKYKGQFAIMSVTYRLAKNPAFNTSYGVIRQELDQMGVQDLSVQAVAQAVMNIRRSKLPDPKEIGNAGSFFKNPQIKLSEAEQLQKTYPSMPVFPFTSTHVKIPAGWLIEQCGWKGYRDGDAGCFAKQALVLVNYGKATGGEIYSLSEEILQSVKRRFGITLEREVNIL